MACDGGADDPDLPHLARRFGEGRLQLFERQRYLPGAFQSLRGLAKARTAQLRQLELQMLDLPLFLQQQALEAFDIVR